MKILTFILVFLALYFFALDLLKVPLLKTSKAVNAVASASKKSKAYQILFTELSELVSHFIYINPYKRQRKDEKLKAAGITDTPEIYTAKYLILALLVGILSVICFIIMSPLLGLLVGILAILVYMLGDDKLNKLIEERRDKIEADLNPFVSHIAKTVAHNKDVVFLLENYIQYCGPELAEQLKITVADMRSGNDKNALQRFEARVNSKELSEVTRGLIAVLSGDDTSAYWANLQIKFGQLQRQRLKRQADKIPGKVLACTLAVAVCFIAMMLVAMFVSMSGELSAFGS